MVTAGIDGMTSSTDKLIAKRALFGRGGPLISGAQIASAEKALPKSAQLMQDFAPAFTMFQVQIKKLAVSFEPLFVGMASEVIPTLMTVVDQLERVDLTEMGVAFGEAIGTATQALIEATSWIASTLKDAAGVIKAISPQTSTTGAAFMGMGGMGTANVVPKAMKEAESGAFLGPAMPGFSEMRELNKARARSMGNKGADTGIDIAAKPEKFTMPVVESLTKVGGGALAGNGNQLLDTQRESLRTQQRMATALERFVTQFKPEPNPYIGINDATAGAA
jgi:hypothetical protein